MQIYGSFLTAMPRGPMAATARVVPAHRCPGGHGPIDEPISGVSPCVCYGRETTHWSPKYAEDGRGGSVEAKGHSRESTTVGPPSLSGSLSDHTSVLVAAVLAALVVAWAALNLL